jgi:transcriptional regulator with XRE-family HTH domain
MSRAKAVSQENREKYIELGLNISFYRRRAGLTQEELAEQADISRSHLSAIEAPNIIRPFSLEILFNLARALHVNPSQLLQFRE